MIVFLAAATLESMIFLGSRAMDQISFFEKINNNRLSEYHSSTISPAKFFKIMIYATFIIISYHNDREIIQNANLNPILSENPEPRLLQAMETQYATSIYSTPIDNSYMVILNQMKTIAFVNTDPGLLIFDITNIQAPILMSKMALAGSISTNSKLVLSTDQKYLFYSNSFSGVYIVNVLNPYAPVLTTKITPANGVKAIAVTSDNRYLYAGTNLEMLIYDLITIGSPVVAGTITNSNNLLNYCDMKWHPANSKYLLATVQYMGLYVYDITSRTSPALIYSQATSTTLAASKTFVVTPDGKTAFILNNGNSMYVMDITTPTAPSLLLTTGVIWGYSISITDDGKTIYLPYGNNGLSLMDVSIRTSPKTKGVLITNDNIYFVAHYDNNYFLSASSGYNFNIYKVNYPLISTIPFAPLRFVNQVYSGQYFDVVVSKDQKYLFAGYYPGGMRIFDITNPLSPVLKSTSTLGGNSYKVGLSADQNTAFLVGYGGTYFSSMDITTRTTITKLTSYTPVSLYTSDLVTTSDGYAYVVENSIGVHVFNIQNPSSLVKITTLNPVLPDGSITIAPNNKYIVFQGNSSYSMIFYDITTRGSPTLVTIVHGHAPRAISADNNFLFTCSIMGVSIYDISSLPSVTQIGYIQTNDCQGVTISSDGKFMYVSDYESGVKVVDITDKTRPILVTAYVTTSAVATAITADGKTLYVANDKDYITILDISTKITIPIPSIYKIGMDVKQNIGVYQNFNGTFLPFQDYYKFAAFASYNIDYRSVSKYQTLPGWATFLSNFGTLEIAPNSASDIGNYSFYVSIATQVPNTIFNGFGGISSVTASQDLCAELVNNGYLDNEYYLTKTFVPSVPMILSSTYTANEAVFRGILNSYYYETFLIFEIYSSLTVTLLTANTPNVIWIDTLSKSPMTVTIDVASGMLIPIYIGTSVTVSANGLRMTISGFLNDIQQAMNQIYVFTNTSWTINGNITVTDSINPPVFMQISNISSYMSAYYAPSIAYSLFPNNTTINEMGTFSLVLSPDIFFDPNIPSSALTYKVREVSANNFELPLQSFMTFDDARFLLTVRSDPTNINFNSVTRVYSKNFTIRFIATNIVGLSSHYDFTIAIINSAPILNIPIQSQIQRAFVTGSQFTFKIAPNTFIDASALQLEYTLSTQDGSPLPSWITYKDLTISGIPDDGPWMNIDLTLKASNKYQSTSNDFTISFRPSISYIINLVLTWVGSILGAIGLYVYLPMAYNIFFFRRYTYPKIFTASFGVPITHENLYSIAFLKGVKQEANKIYKKMKREFDRNPYRKKHINDEYFDENHQSFDEGKLQEEIRKHCSTINPSKLEILTILLKDKMFLNQINRPQNHRSKMIFNQIKLDWVGSAIYVKSEFENPMLNALTSFKINYDNLERYINAHNHKVSSIVQAVNNTTQNNSTMVFDLESEQNITANPTSKETKPVISFDKNVKIALLQGAIMAYFRSKHHMDSNIYEVTIQGGIVKTKNPILKFLKKDIMLTGEGGDLGLGIKTQSDYETLSFQGDPQENMNHSIFNVRIYSKLGFLLREIHIKGHQVDMAKYLLK